jgi:adenylate kinase family enzyme
MKIHIMGASGSGVTTLGHHLSTTLTIPYFDNDDFYWEKSEDPFTIKRQPEQRNALLQNSLEKYENWILGGSMLNWNNNELIACFDLVVFLWIPADIRLERLRKREFGRYGQEIYQNPIQQKKTQDFLNWAAGYDVNATNTTRTIHNHQMWLHTLNCPVLKVEGDYTVEERTNFVKQKLVELSLLPSN